MLLCNDILVQLLYGELTTLNVSAAVGVTCMDVRLVIVVLCCDANCAQIGDWQFSHRATNGRAVAHEFARTLGWLLALYVFVLSVCELAAGLQ